jgi:lysophospholipase L1-like esterase
MSVTKAPAVTCHMGDSLNLSYAWMVKAHQYWPEVLAALLRGQGYSVKARNWGNSGDTTTNMIARMACLTRPQPPQFVFPAPAETPALCTIWGGANDPGGSIATATTQANLQALVKGVKFGCLGTQANVAALLATGKVGDRYVVMSDSDSTGGVAALSADQLPTITGPLSAAQTVWEFRLPLAGNAGWGRVATAGTKPTHCSKVLVVSMHYLNWSSGGDTQSTPYANYNATTGVRSAQIAAAAAESGGAALAPSGNVIYADIYTPFYNRIQQGLDTQGSFSWHVADQNVHLNPYGNVLVAQFLLAIISAQPGWLNAFATQAAA